MYWLNYLKLGIEKVIKNFIPIAIATMLLRLRRTLVRSYRLSSM
jgi:hypothetical protein